ncbi:MAG: S8 family serine peptidase [Candidatus Thorarchaeota archaeon]
MRSKVKNKRDLFILIVLSSFFILYLSRAIWGLVAPISYIRVGQTVAEYQGGDGIDLEAQAWLNIDIAKAMYESLPINRSRIAIIDSGLATSAWTYIEANSKSHVLQYIRCNEVFNLWPPPFFWKWDGTYSVATDPDDPIVTDINGHGTAVTSILANTLPHAEIIFISIQRGHPSMVEGALRWVKTNHKAFNIRTVSISTGATSDYERFHDEITYLYGNGVTIVCAAGNGGASETNCYPAGFSETLAIGAHYDDPDGFLEDGTAIREAGNVVTSKRSRQTSEYANSWSSMCGPILDFVVPGYDIEFLQVSNNDDGEIKFCVGGGTSFSAPLAAAITSWVIDAYYCFHSHIEWDYDSSSCYLFHGCIPHIEHEYPSPETVHLILSQTAEFYDATPNTEDRVPKPKPFGYRIFHPDLFVWNEWVGYGVLDAYDAIILAIVY